MGFPKLTYDKITLNPGGITIDDVLIDGMKVARGIIVHHSGRDTVGASVTLTIHADEVDVTDAIQDFAKEHGTPIIEVHGDTCLRSAMLCPCDKYDRTGHEK